MARKGESVQVQVLQQLVIPRASCSMQCTLGGHFKARTDLSIADLPDSRGNVRLKSCATTTSAEHFIP